MDLPCCILKRASNVHPSLTRGTRGEGGGTAAAGQFGLVSTGDDGSSLDVASWLEGQEARNEVRTSDKRLQLTNERRNNGNDAARINNRADQRDAATTFRSGSTSAAPVVYRSTISLTYLHHQCGWIHAQLNVHGAVSLCCPIASSWCNAYTRFKLRWRKNANATFTREYVLHFNFTPAFRRNNLYLSKQPRGKPFPCVQEWSVT